MVAGGNPGVAEERVDDVAAVGSFGVAIVHVKGKDAFFGAENDVLSEVVIGCGVLFETIKERYRVLNFAIHPQILALVFRGISQLFRPNKRL